MEALKALLAGEKSPETMFRIAEIYLTELQDPVAAEAWLQKTMETGDPVWGPAAMGMLARRILGREVVLSYRELQEICCRLKHAAGEEKLRLQSLRALASPRQKNCFWYENSLQL